MRGSSGSHPRDGS